ncbi:MAG: endo-1,4-beta-xylanase [Symploca sp. SIO2D2]|nr:endo-1,4-beta-xylanase [Symploca sp. SIO2D2]
MSKKWLLTRRGLLCLGLGTLASIGTLAKSKALNNQARDFTVVGEASLKERAAAKGLIYGAAAKYRTLSSDVEFAAYFPQECAILAPENDLKWRGLRPSPDRFDFTKSDWLVEFAYTNNMLLQGHTLVWHNGLPKWFKEKVNRQNAEPMLIDHIKKVAGHYAGKMHSWDVVNEAVYPTHGRANGLRNSPWLELLDSDYIELAFHVAREADPQALLVYNENHLWYEGQLRANTPTGEAKRTAVLKLLERLKSRGTPIDVLGIQGHLRGHQLDQLNSKKLRAFLTNVADLDLKIMITELDVRDHKLPKDIDVRDRLVATAYEDFLSVVLDEPAVMAVITWGLSDRDTWLSKFARRKDGLPVRPLPLDDQLNRKLAWNAIARAFDNAPMR